MKWPRWFSGKPHDKPSEDELFGLLRDIELVAFRREYPKAMERTVRLQVENDRLYDEVNRLEQALKARDNKLAVLTKQIFHPEVEDFLVGTDGKG